MNLQAEFPAVSVCNTNRIHCGNLNKTLNGRIAELAESNVTLLDPSAKCDIGGAHYELDLLQFFQLSVCTRGSVNWTAYDDDDDTTFRCTGQLKVMNFYDEYEDGYDEDEDEGKDGDDYEEGVVDVDFFDEIFLYLYTTLKMATRLEIGHQFHDLVKSCTFKTFDCRREKYVGLRIPIPSYMHFLP